jgi:hypothetical protein
MTEVKVVFIQTRPVHGPHDLGQIVERHYTREGDMITLTHPDGAPLRRSRDEKWQVRIGLDENEKAVAKGLLRRMWNTEHPNSKFWQQLPYKPPSIW